MREPRKKGVTELIIFSRGFLFGDYRGPGFGTMDVEPIPKFPLLLGEGWGEGKQLSESIEKTSSDLSHPHPRPLSRRTGEGRLWNRL